MVIPPSSESHQRDALFAVQKVELRGGSNVERFAGYTSVSALRPFTCLVKYVYARILFLLLAASPFGFLGHLFPSQMRGFGMQFSIIGHRA
jgi:hypothetical protein